MDGSSKIVEAPRESWRRRWLIAPVRDQLTRGMSVDKVAWTISLGFVLGVFPVMGTTSLICLLAGWMFHLNQGLLHVFKAVVYPLHLALILVFIRMGGRFWGAPLITFSISELLVEFKADPFRFGRDFGIAAWHGVSAWLLLAPVAALLFYWAVRPVVRGIARTLKGVTS